MQALDSFTAKQLFTDADNRPLLYSVPKVATSNVLPASAGSAIGIIYFAEQNSLNLSDSLHNLLSKILLAVNYDIKDCILINQADKETAIPFAYALQDCENAEFLLGFGVHPSKLQTNFNFKAYQTYKYQQLQLLFAHSLSYIAQNKKAKAYLWSALQEMFV